MMRLALYSMTLSAIYAWRAHIVQNWWLSLIWATVGIVAFMMQAAASVSIAAPDCMTLREARAMYPKDHLYQQRGCWGTRQRATIRKSKPVTIPDEPATDAPQIGNEIAVADANASYAYHWEDAPRERFVSFALKEDREQIRRVDNFPLPLPPEALAPIDEPVVIKKSSGPFLSAWVILLGVGIGFAAALAFTISQVRGLRPPSTREYPDEKGRRYEHANIKRSDFTSSTRRERAPSGSDGARDQQPHFYSRDFYERSGGAYQHGHADHPDALGDRRDNTGALGAWARSRGLRPESVNQYAQATDSDSFPAAAEWYRTHSASRVGWFRKRLAKLAR